MQRNRSTDKKTSSLSHSLSSFDFASRLDFLPKPLRRYRWCNFVVTLDFVGIDRSLSLCCPAMPSRQKRRGSIDPLTPFFSPLSISFTSSTPPILSIRRMTLPPSSSPIRRRLMILHAPSDRPAIMYRRANRLAAT